MGWLAYPLHAPAAFWAWFVAATNDREGAAAWVQAIFTIIAIFAAVLIPVFQRRAERRGEITRRRGRTFVVAAMLRGDFHFLLTEVRIRQPDVAGYQLPRVATPTAARTYFAKIAVPIPQRFTAAWPNWIEGTDLVLIGPINDFVIAIQRHNNFITQLIAQLDGDASELPSEDEIRQSIIVVSDRLAEVLRAGRETWLRIFPDQKLPN